MRRDVFLKSMFVSSVALVLACCTLCAAVSASESVSARRILDVTGVKGGLVVHVGCGDGKLTVALRANDSYLVHGLDADAANVDKARERIRSLGLCGKVSVAQCAGNSLPYTDNLVNLVVSEDLGDVSMDEVVRVLCPEGVACYKRDGKWFKTVKSRPEEIDEWTHYLHDASGNAVAHDTVVGPPRSLQWVGSPRWARHHDHMASMSALVSSGARIFYIFDEGPTSSIQLPPKWSLIARDAFNGTVLWKRSLPSWYVHLWPLKSGPALLTRRLVAVGDRVYLTLGINAPLSALDAATGEVVRTYEGTKTAEEIIVSNGMIIARVNPAMEPVEYAQEDANCWKERDRASRRWGWDGQERQLMAIEPESGKVLWRDTRPVAPLSLAADGEHVLFHDGEQVVCLDQETGKEIWSSKPVQKARLIPTGYSPTMVVHDDVVLFSGRQRSLTALSVQNGETLWTAKQPASGHFSPEDVFVIDGLVWAGATAQGKSRGDFVGRDLHTGEIEKQFPCDVETFFMHQRCYPSKATDRYIIPGRTGTEFVDPETEHWTIHHWIRGGCVYGVMPCNGMIYAPSHSCACYYQSKLNGFCAVGPVSALATVEGSASDAQRLERGPVYGEPVDVSSSSDDEWPAYRHDSKRSGFTEAPVPSDLKRAWQADIGGRLSSMTLAGDRVFVASIDEHTVHALDAGSGKTLWSYTAGGRVDSPPTIFEGRVLFGAADGWVYCLRASDGDLIWRFRAAPADRRLVSYEQVESVWPVHGSILVQDGVAYCLAGRSMFLDGGMRLVRLDPETGRKLSETVLDDLDPRTGENLQTKIRDKKMPVVLPDVLSSDGEFVYMRSQRFDLNGRRTKIDTEPEHRQFGEGIHLFSPTGFLDDTWFHRSYWVYGRTAGEGWSEWPVAARLVPSGRILAFDDTHVYGYGRDPEYLCNSSILEYRLFAADKELDPERMARVRQADIKEGNVNWKNRSERPVSDLCAVSYKWQGRHPPLLVQAIVLADKTLFVAGPPDVVDEKAMRGRSLEPEFQEKMRAQSAAFAGEKGGLLWAVSAEDGKKLAGYKLESVPVFDGMIAAKGRLYLAMKDGSVSCFAGDSDR